MTTKFKYERGSVVHVVYFHLDSAVLIEKKANKEFYKVESKIRPMLVLSFLEAHSEYLLLKMTTKDHPGQILIYRMGELNSYVELAPQKYPANLIKCKSCSIRVGREIFSSIQKKLSSIALGFPG